MKKLIGGEFWFSPDIFSLKKTASFSNSICLSGGQSAINYIIEDLGLEEGDTILMPSYLCPTILIPLDNRNIKVEFYLVDEKLRIDIGFLKSKLDVHVKAIYIIDYFGFFHDNDTVNFLKELKGKGIKIIEDAVQSLWHKEAANFTGNYIFNSYRKVLPVDGSIVLCDRLKGVKIGDCVSSSGYSREMNYARILKSLYVYLNMGNEDTYLKKFKNAQDMYYSVDSPCSMSRASKMLLEHIDYKKIAQKRKNNYKCLYNLLKNTETVKMIYSDNVDGCVPLVLPIVVENRDFIRKELMKANIFTAVHWNINSINRLTKQYDISKKLSGKILSLPIDQRYNSDDMERAAQEISRITGEVL